MDRKGGGMGAGAGKGKNVEDLCVCGGGSDVSLPGENEPREKKERERERDGEREGVCQRAVGRKPGSMVVQGVRFRGRGARALAAFPARAASQGGGGEKGAA